MNSDLVAWDVKIEAELPKLPKMLPLFAMDLALLTSFEQHSIRIEGRRFFVRRGIALGVAHDSRARQLEAFRPAVSASWARFSDRQEKTREKARKRKRRGRGKIDRSKLSWRVSTGRNRERGD
jgi:hypothetical protein